jgi:hypothetical protein
VAFNAAIFQLSEDYIDIYLSWERVRSNGGCTEALAMWMDRRGES